MANVINYGTTPRVISAQAVQKGEVLTLLTEEIPTPPTPAGEIVITLYQNSSEQNRLDKTDYLKSTGTLNGTFREPTSVTSPSITIEMEGVPTFNYIHIPNFNRYYYVTEITNIRKNIWQIDCTVDVLMSYKDAIVKCPARVERNQYEYNVNIPDNRRIVECGSEITDVQVTNNVFNTTGNYQFVMNGYKLNAVIG